MIATARAAAEAPRTVLFYGLLSIPRTLWACTAPERRHVRRNWRVAGGSANRPTLVASPGGVCYVAADQQSSGMAQNASRSSDPAYDPRIRRFVADLEPMPAGAPSAQQAVGAE